MHQFNESDKCNANSYLRSMVATVQKLESKLICANRKEANVSTHSDNSCMKSSGRPWRIWRDGGRDRLDVFKKHFKPRESKSYCNPFLSAALSSSSDIPPLTPPVERVGPISPSDIKSLLALQPFPLRLCFLWIRNPSNPALIQPLVLINSRGAPASPPHYFAICIQLTRSHQYQHIFTKRRE